MKKTFLIVMGLVVAFFAFILVTSILNTATNVATAPGRVISRTVETDNIITNYEWFKRRYNSIKAIDKRIENNEAQLKAFIEGAGPRANWTFEDKNEYSRLTTIITGVKSQRADMVAEYNARSQMTNRSIFKTDELPERID